MADLYLENSYKLETVSNYRKKSISQKIRRDLLKTYILYPDQIQKINKLIVEFNSLTDNRYENIDDILHYSYEDDFNDFLLKKSTFNQESNKPSDTAKNIADFFKKIKNNNLVYFLHGSHADSMTTHYSDIDLSVFVKKTFLKDVTQTRADIYALNNFIKKFDLGSHHAIFLNSYEDKNYYPESFMPLSVLKKSLTNLDNSSTFFQTRYSYDLTLDNFYNLSNHILQLTRDLTDFNSNNLKILLSEYFMIIILYEQFCNNNFKDKKTIFLDILKNEDKKKRLSAFQTCSDIRINWPKQNNLNIFGVSKFLIKNIISDVKYLNKEIKKSKNYEKIIKIIC
jgi:hypothetical protein